jgi:hypothetical protein
MHFRVFCDPEAADAVEYTDVFGVASISIETPYGDLDVMRLVKPDVRFHSKDDLGRYLAETFDVPPDRVSVDIE